MVDSTILRPLTEDEKRSGIKEVGSADIKKFFVKRVHDKEQEYTKLHKPFCRRCAILDFDDLLESKKKELMRRFGHVSETSKEIISLDIKDLDRYGDPARFEKTGENEVTEFKLLDGIKQAYVTGYWEDYKCSYNNCKISVFVPIPPVNREAAHREIAEKTDKKKV